MTQSATVKRYRSAATREASPENAHWGGPVLVLASDYDALAAQCEALAEEIRYLRTYGNKDCTHMADQARERHELD